jgi:hypothetical protein
LVEEEFQEELDETEKSLLMHLTQDRESIAVAGRFPGYDTSAIFVADVIPYNIVVSQE